MVITSGSTQQSRIHTRENSLPAYQFSIIIEQAYSQLGNLPIHWLKLMLSAVWGLSIDLICTMPQSCSIPSEDYSSTWWTVLIVNGSDDKRSFLCKPISVENVQQYCAEYDRYYPSLWRNLIVRWLCFTPPLHLVGCGAAFKVIY